MNTIEALKQRRTIRSYEKDWVCPKDILETITNVALDSPTGCNCQGIDLVVITNKDKIKAIADATLNSFPKDKQEYFLTRKEEFGVENVITCDAPILYLLVSNERSIKDFVQIDAGIMVEHLLAAATNFGLGSMCIGALLWGNVEEIEKIAGLAKGSLVMAVSIGKPKENLKLPPKERICKATYIE